MKSPLYVIWRNSFNICFCLSLHEQYHITWNCVFLWWFPQVRTLHSFKIILPFLAHGAFAAGACQMWNNGKCCLVLDPKFSSILSLSGSCCTVSDLFRWRVAGSQAYGFPCLNKSEMSRCLCYLCDMKGYVSITIFTWK